MGKREKKAIGGVLLLSVLIGLSVVGVLVYMRSLSPIGTAKIKEYKTEFAERFLAFLKDEQYDRIVELFASSAIKKRH